LDVSIADEQHQGSRLPTAVADSLVAPLRDATASVGDIAVHGVSALRALGGVWRFSGEVIRQAGILITGSAVVMLVMMFLVGEFCGLEGNYGLQGYGASSFTGVFTAWCGIREAGPINFGLIFAAKVGCGYVAQIGTMRVTEELDALECMGVNPMQYIVATRLLAVWLVIPPLFLLGIVVEQLASFFAVLIEIGQLSRGSLQYFHFLYQNPTDLLYSTGKAAVFATVVVVLATYYGYRARNGPVGVGAATARTMVLSIVLIMIVNGLLTATFWPSVSPNAPVGG
jgi:phospholipid/cholesterol/gamma-HCH transport system permease protein